MISVTEAIQLIQNHLPPPNPIKIPLEKALGFVLAEDIFSPIDVPSFEQSAMDGYAFDFESIVQNTPIAIAGIIQAGAEKIPRLEKVKAVRIFTGAPLPEGADTVVMQEKTTLVNHQLFINDAQLIKGTNVRNQASQTAKGDCVLSKNTPINAGIMGFLAGLGIYEVPVYAKPKIALMVTGKELVQPGKSLQFGQVYESNSYTLRAALTPLGIDIEQVVRVGDELAETIHALEHLIKDCNLLIITGGISVGDYDYVQDALIAIGVEKIFYKIKQKPGKPMFVGKKGETIIFALPGNPAAVHTCFYRYIRPSILQIMGHSDTFSYTHRLQLNQDFHKKAALTHFLKGKMKPDGTVDILLHQESYKMNVYAEANGLIVVEEEKNVYEMGEFVDFLHIF